MYLSQVDIQKQFVPAGKINSIGGIVNLLLPIMLIGSALIFLAMSLFGGFMYITQGDNPEGLKKARSTVIFAVLGLVIVIISFVAVQIIGKMFGIQKII
ncbi:hypothetical protein B6D29_04150 [Microgenomates bacterium UTCPR1]|nr:hypothetical protein [Patescibacteria group bacterium]OQY65341.1 MAG: hypothetical protein B6D29_04150 [Microgenomates bacterium UTCPR1]